MAYRIDVTLLDLDGVFGGAIPSITGTLTGFPPGGQLSSDVGVPIPVAAPTSVLFPATTSGMFPACVVLSDAGAPTGQVFRSGVVTLPPSPGQVTLYTAVGGISVPGISAFATSLGGTQLKMHIADGWKALGYLFGFLPPETITITSATITPVAATPSTPGSLSVTVTGSATYRFFVFVPFTQTFRISTSVAIAPSGDCRRTDRIVSVTPSGTTLTLPQVDPTLPFNQINGTLTDALEPVINRAITSAVDAFLAARMPPSRRTATSVISARAVSITSLGISAQIMLADFGPAVAAFPRTLALSVTPAPAPDVQQTYRFHVVDRASGSPIAGATVAVTNRNPTTIQTAPPTDGQGDTTLTLRLRTETVGGAAHLAGDPRVLQPYATATAPSAQATTLMLTLVELA